MEAVRGWVWIFSGIAHLRGSEKPHRRNNWDVKTYVRENAGTLNPNESEINGILISRKFPFSGKLMEH